MGIAKRGGHRLKAINLNLSDLNIKLFIKQKRLVADKVTEIKKPPENPFHKPLRDIKCQLTSPFAIASNNSHDG